MKLKEKMYKGAVIASATAMPLFAFADAAAQPDTTDATAYIAAGAATLLAVFAGKYVLQGVIYVARLVKSAIGR